MLSGLLVHRFGLEQGTALSISALALTIPIRIGIEAWGKAYNDRQDKHRYLQGELNALTEMTALDLKAKSQEAHQRLAVVNFFAHHAYDIKIGAIGISLEEAFTLLLQLSQDTDPEVRAKAIGAYWTLSGIHGISQKVSTESLTRMDSKSEIPVVIQQLMKEVQ
jgi:hypothetical protein